MYAYVHRYACVYTYKYICVYIYRVQKDNCSSEFFVKWTDFGGRRYCSGEKDRNLLTMWFQRALCWRVIGIVEERNQLSFLCSYLV